MKKFKTKGEAMKYVSRLSSPDKMPCYGYSLPAATCKIGSKLRKVENSVCHSCYAHKGNYTRFPVVQKALYRRFKAIRKKYWKDAMIFLIKDMEYFRWHDSGDIQDPIHLNNILDIAEACPKTKFWLPTREYQIVEMVLKERKCPPNMFIRLSSHMINTPGPVQLAKKLGVQISEVSDKKYTCPASDQGGKCLDCRTCWSPKMNVVYHKH